MTEKELKDFLKEQEQKINIKMWNGCWLNL